MKGKLMMLLACLFMGASVVTAQTSKVTGLVIGAEGTGISRLVRDTCDFIGVLPMVGEIESLNAGVAAAICMYEVLRQRKVK